MTIELRSDTFTKPTPAMLEAMFTAEVGDDVFEDDPTVIALEQKAANMFGYEAALFCTSGTMTNQIAINVHVKQGDEVICDALSHIYLYEGGGIAANSLASVNLLEGDRGRLKAWQIKEVIQPENIHHPISALVSLENTVNKGGGAYYQLTDIQEIKQLCIANNIPLHLDGARIFNALVETEESPLEYGKVFDSMSVCLSKGLGTPIGSVLLGTKAFIKKAKRVRKRLGGGWRQAGYLAAAGIYALDHNINRLKEDHTRASIIGETMAKLPEVENVLPVDTNIVILNLNHKILATDYVQQLNAKGIRATTFGKHQVRFVTHLDFTDDHLTEFQKRILQ
ncbi:MULTISPECIES: GntG family PLP-dependent aldolase [unclassified Arcicella]|uniref:threonine aldolase family protein n=1 Tax=unclassified Arcicella TaxID=2644986 RepID=UPI00285EA71C|nr:MULTISPECIES: GntG family PLP-dependent aldolase [unclassified Arcicella]MDR6564389.1 threonine aldolase [Arcicella sp. BE51]MDR6814138.1 threonine aldolase [Arcicella sp. BE140]MDR6825450.1 threonine aldolase [Arcicella sp. BE139]